MRSVGTRVKVKVRSTIGYNGPLTYLVTQFINPSVIDRIIIAVIIPLRVGHGKVSPGVIVLPNRLLPREKVIRYRLGVYS